MCFVDHGAVLKTCVAWLMQKLREVLVASQAAKDLSEVDRLAMGIGDTEKRCPPKTTGTKTPPPPSLLICSGEGLM